MNTEKADQFIPIEVWDITEREFQKKYLSQ